MAAGIAEKQIDRRLSLALLAAALVVLVAETATVAVAPFPLLDPDEPLFALVAREMIAGGDYLVPRIDGEPFLDRPAPYYWALVGCVKLFGETDAAMRLASVPFGALTVVGIGLLAREMFGRLAGAAAVLVGSTVVAHGIVMLAVTHDSPLVAFITLAAWAQWRLFRSCGRRETMLFVFAGGCFMGLAVLSKGLLGVVIPGLFFGSLVGVDVCRRSTSWSFAALAHAIQETLLERKRLLAAAAVQFIIALAIGASWYLAVESVQPGFLEYFFIDRHVRGFATSSQRHGEQSVFVYVPTLLLGGLPWSILLAAPAWNWIRERIKLSNGSQSTDHAATSVALWLGLIILFFTVAGSKNPTYLLPAYPPMAVLAGRLLARWIECDSECFLSMRRLPIATLGVFAIAAIVAVGISSPTWSDFGAGLGWMVAFAAAVGFAVRGISSWLGRRWDERGHRIGLVAIEGAAVLFAALSTQLIVLPIMSNQRSGQTAAAFLSQHGYSKRVSWYFHVPPSARYYGRELTFERVNLSHLQSEAAFPRVLVVRESRLGDVLNSPFSAEAEHIDLGGKYHIFTRPAETTDATVDIARDIDHSTRRE